MTALHLDPALDLPPDLVLPRWSGALLAVIGFIVAIVFLFDASRPVVLSEAPAAGEVITVVAPS